MEMGDLKDNVCSKDSENLSFCAGTLCSTLQYAFSAWLKTFVIKKSSGNLEEWHFRTLFVVELTILPILTTFVFVFWWVINRNVRLRKTKGSSIPLLDMREEDDGSLSDEHGDYVYDDDIQKITKQKSPRRRRKKIEAILKASTVELDDDDHDDETLNSTESYLAEDSDDEEGTGCSSSLKSNIGNKLDSSTTKMFLSEQRLNLWKAVKEIPIFSFFSEEALEICMNDIEYVDLSKQNDFLWEEGKFDGSLFYVVKGRVRVEFLDFRAPSSDRRFCDEENKVANVIHDKDTVITSQLALIEGMVRQYLHGKSSSLSPFVGLALSRTTAQALEDDTRLLRIPPSCFARILDRFPETILRIIQTTLNRTQRVTIQIMVRCCGLRQELFVPINKEINKCMLEKEFGHWKTLQDSLKRTERSKTGFDHQENNHLLKNACATLASMLNIKELGTIEVLEENCSLLSLGSETDDADRTVLKAGSSHDFCYLLLQGAMELGIYLPVGESSSKELQNDASAWYFQRLEKLSPGSLLGESALFTTDVNLFEVRCIPSQESCQDHTILLKIPKDMYAQLVVKHPQAMVISLVSVLPVLSPVVHFLTWTTEWIHVEAAGEIVQKDTPCNSLYVVLNGRLRAANRAKHHRRAIGASSPETIPPEEYGRGKIFGQVGSLANVIWPFDVFAIRQSELAKVPIKTIEVIVQNFPYTGLFLARVVASDVESLHYSNRTYLQNSRNAPSKHINGLQNSPFRLPSYGLNLATIAVVPLSYNINLKRFCSTLTQSMEAIAPCKLLTKSMVRRDLGEQVYQNRTALRDLKMTRLLADLEENNRVVIYQADQRFTFWTRLCVLQADYILLVVDSHEVPKTTNVEQTVAWAYEAMDVHIDLVVVGKEGKVADSIDANSDVSCNDEDDVSVSDQLNNWSESRKWIAGHHLVRAPFGRYQIDFQRMSRRISGRSVGLALGAGGARGIAHLGVIRALIEAGVTVDMVGGTSQGAFCGALFARYPDDYEQVLNNFKAMAVDAASMKEKLFDLTLPMASMFNGRNFNKGIKRLLGNLRIQDLVLNFFCVSTDLQNQHGVIHTKGQLWKSVRASMGLTGYLPPISENGSLLVDGAYLNSLPADVMKFQMGARTVIAVDVCKECKRQYFEYGAHLSGWWVLWNSWNPFVKTVQVPSMGDISDMLIWVSSEQHRKAVKDVCDLHLTPPIQDVGILEYERFDEIVEKSYNYSKPIVDEWVRKNPWLVSTPKENVYQ